MNVDKDQVVSGNSGSAGEALDATPALPALPEPEDVRGVALDAMSGLIEQAPWVAPLIESALSCPAELRRPVVVLTRWGGGRHSGQEDDPQKHAAYVAHMVETIDASLPWLMPLLNAANAELLVAPGICAFTVRSRLGIPFDIPQLVPFTWMTPFGPGEEDAIH